MKGFLEYVPGDSLLHRMNPVAKLAAAFLLVIACFATSNLALLALVIVLDAVLAVQCKMVSQTLGLAKAVALFSLVLALIALLFTPQGDVLAQLPWGYIVHFIPVFMNDMAGIMEAQTARGVEFDGGFLKRIRLMMPLCVPLLVSSVRKTNSAAIAAEVRGFNLRTWESGFKEYPFAGIDFAALAVAVAIAAAAVALSVLL